jgi:hypothetical protein
MGKKFTVGLTAVALMVVGVANAQQPVRVAKGMQIEPIRMAPISADGKIGNWVKYNPNHNNRAAWTMAFDAFEADMAGGWPDSAPADNQYGADCAMGGSRWFFGETYDNSYCSNDMDLANATDGKLAEHVNVAWFWYVGGPGTSEQCYIAVWTSEDAPDGSAPFGGGFSGVLYDFGVLNSGSGAGYYYSNIDLTGSGLGHQLPVDGRGGYQIFLANATSGGGGPGGLDDCTLGQPMLWGIHGSNPSGQDEFQYDDDNPANDMFDVPAEYYSYLYGVCPDPLCAMMEFDVAGSGSSTEEVCPGSFSIMFGSLVSGAIGDVCASDDAKMVFANGSTFLITQSPITVKFNGTTTKLTPTENKITVEYSVSLANLKARIDMFNYTTNAYVQVDERNASLADEVVTVSKTSDAGDYVGNAGEVSTQVRVRDDVPAFLASWNGRYDVVKSSVTG